MKDAIVIVAGKRTPFGAFGGSLKNVTATELGIRCSKAAIADGKVDPKMIDAVIFGNVVQSDANSIYAPRHIGLHCGIPIEVPALGVNRLCGSGFEALVQAAQLIQLGEATMVLAGGVESMSQVPFVARDIRWGKKLGHSGMQDYLMEALVDGYCGCPMAETAENLAKRYQITREQCDEFALHSQQNTAKAEKEGFFKAERMPLEELASDEHPRAQTTLDALAKLRPAFRKDGMVTPGNASGMVDGAAALLVTTESIAHSQGLPILGRLSSWASCGVEPSEMGIGPAPATRMALKRVGLNLSDIDLFEINEAFAAQTLAVAKELDIDPTLVNPHGGAIAIGHPLGASGARITLTALNAMRSGGKSKAAVSACIGGGQGICLVLEA